MAAVLVTDMEHRLPAFLSAATGRRFAWGTHDCMLFAADWVRELHGIDPAAPWRGTYGSADEAKTIVDNAGGMAPLIHAAVTPLGWQGVGGAARGDIALVRSPTRFGQQLVASVFVGHGKFALLTGSGLVIAPAPFVLGWRAPRLEARAHG